MKGKPRSMLGLLGWGFTVALALALVSVTAVYALSERELRAVPKPPPFRAEIPTDKAVIEQGRHIARTRGCFGCHGQQLQGQVFDEWSWVDRAVAPALGTIARSASVAELEWVIRHGIGVDGRALWSMPSYNFVRLSDEDLISLIAYLRTVDTPAADLPTASLGIGTRLTLIIGQETSMATWAQAVPPLMLDTAQAPELALGEYLAMTSCNECHGLDLRGQTQYEMTPDLAIVTAYSRPEFEQLMRKGVGRGGRQALGLMSMVAKDRFAAWTPGEVDALYAYLQTLAVQPQPTGVFWRPSGAH